MHNTYPTYLDYYPKHISFIWSAAHKAMAADIKQEGYSIMLP